MGAGSPNTRNLWGILCLKIWESQGIPFAIEWEMQIPYSFSIWGKRRVFTQYWSWSRGNLVKTLGTKWNFLLYIFVSITFQGKYNFFWSAISEKWKALEEGHANKMFFPYVHFSICHLAEKIRLFFWARKIRFFFHSWELKAGKGSAGERMEGDCSIPFMSFFKWFYILKNPISLVFQHMLNPKF